MEFRIVDSAKGIGAIVAGDVVVIGAIAVASADVVAVGLSR